MRFQSINPSTGELLEEFEFESRVEERLEQNRKAFLHWRKVSFQERSRLMERAASLLEENRELYARTMTEEMGKPITQSRAEVDKCAWVCRYYAEKGEAFLSPRTVSTDAARSYVRYDPLGSVLAVMPWNFPFWQVFRFAAPTLMAGNGGVLKHAPNVPRSALLIEKLFLEAGFPEELFLNLFLSVEQVADVIRDDRIHAVTLTGSEGAGASVAELAGRSLKKSVLELGGSDPFIVLEDADLREAARNGVASRSLNSGQSCIAAKRFIVMQGVAEEFAALFQEELKRLKTGDPLQEETQMGPMAREDLRTQLHDQVDDTVRKGGELRMGGVLPSGNGFFYPVTLITRVKRGMAAADQETFGPLAALLPVESEEEAVRLANETRYGLGASLWTKDLDRAERIAPWLEAGSVFVNSLVKSDPRLPFGGIKKSGYGRELSEEGIREFVNTKTVWVDSPPGFS